jgi:hypothetical protein
MSIVLPAIGVAFAAFCVWLAVRIINRRERWAKWTAVGLVMAIVVVYPLSIGPACWIVAKPRAPFLGSGPNSYPECHVWIGYWPIGWFAHTGKKRPIRTDKNKKRSKGFDPLVWYASLWLPHGSLVTIPASSDGRRFLMIAH